MAGSLGEHYLSHYERFFGSHSGHQVFRVADGLPAIQILEYRNVFPKCRVFCSLGLSHFTDEISAIGEVYVPVDAGWESVPRLLAESLFFVVRDRMTLGRGTAIAGLGKIDQVFVHRYSKSAMYLAMPFGLPPGFDDFGVPCGVAHMLLGIFITQAEFDYFADHGAERLEELLESKCVDPYVLARPSCI